jgi:hypothetical protein
MADESFGQFDAREGGKRQGTIETGRDHGRYYPGNRNQFCRCSARGAPETKGFRRDVAEAQQIGFDRAAITAVFPSRAASALRIRRIPGALPRKAAYNRVLS